MAARTPRRSFAAPFVVTLAAAPACYVSNAPPPQQPPPAAPAEQAPAHNAPGVVVANPPRPQPEGTPVAVANPPRPQDPPVPAAPQDHPVVVANPPRPQDHPVVVANPPRPHAQPAGTTWHVFKSGDGCEAAVHVDCPKGATCNPPPPRKVECPVGLTMPKGLDIVSQGDGTCIVAQEPVHCPPHAMCNPPRPRNVACPE